MTLVRPYQIRVQWMKLMGFSDEEIKKSVRDIPPINYKEEMQELEASKRIQEMNKNERSRKNN